MKFFQARFVWTRLGREFRQRGELRLALRAFYLASLSHLAAKGLVTVARFKSNRDYERELRRRGHAFLICSPSSVRTSASLTAYGMGCTR
jgi:hypothetical protein